MRYSRLAAVAASVTVLVTLTAGCKALDEAGSIQIPSVGPASTEIQQVADPTSTAAGSATADAADALRVLATLPVKGRAPKTGYSRSQFGKAWTDDVTVEGGGNSCATREDVLLRDLADVVFMKGSACKIASGTLHDQYTGKTINFVRGQKTSALVQVDHLVPLADSWQKGAQQLTLQERTNLANDPRNLQAVDGPTNAAKGAGDAATWLPGNKRYRCTYVSRQIAVKKVYRLWVTQAEKDAMQRVLGKC